VDATLAWTVVGSVAGIAGASAVIVFGVIPLVQARRKAPERSDDRGGTAAATGVLLPAPVLAVRVRGREDMIATLLKLVSGWDDYVHVLTGLGGAGKSTVARAVAAQIAADGGRVWWVPAGEAVLLAQRLLGLAQELGASPGQIEDAHAGRVNPSDVLWGQLGKSPGWTLILDNADDLAALTVGGWSANSGSGWLRQSRAGLVLVTSRVGDGQAWGPVARMHRLEPLAEEDGAQVLLDLAPQAGNERAAQSLSGQLGGLPLALHQAGSYLASPFATETTFAEYEAALSERFGELMSRGDDDRAKVIVTWELSLAALRNQGNQHAETLLRVLSCFASSVAVPALLLDRDLLAGMCGTRTAVEDGFSGLLSVGLIDIVKPAASGRPDVKVHSLVAQTIRFRAGEGLLTSMQQAVDLFAAAVYRLDPRDPATGAHWLALVPHLQELQLTDLPLPVETESSLAAAAAQVSMAMLWSGQYAAALTAADSGIKRGHGLPNDHPRVLELRGRRASSNGFLGHYIDAENEYRQVLAAQLQVLDPDHPAVLGTRHNLAQLLRREAKTAEAEAEFRRIFAAQLRVLGPDDPGTLSTRANLAAVLSQQGKHADAESEFRQVLDAQLRVLGPDHPGTLSTRNSLAQLLVAEAKTAEAEAEFQQVLDAQLRVLGPDHPDTLTTRNSLAQLLVGQAKTAEAEAEFQQVLDAQLRVLGPDHPDTLTTRHNLAAVLSRQGEHADAESEFRQVLDAWLRVLGPDHPGTLTTRANLAMVLSRQGKHADAESEFRQVLDARLRVLGPDDPATLTTRANLAMVLSRQGKHADAESEFRQVLDARLRVLGPDDPATLTTRANLAMVLSRQGKHADAESEFQSVLDARLRVLGPDHPDTLVARRRLQSLQNDRRD
jgi:tetratricopeptide (TPR) repeat protein